MLIYREIPRLQGYRFGDDGSIESRWSRRGVLTARWRAIRPYRTKAGRLQVNIRTGRRVGESYLVHRLILEAFVGPCPPGMESCHYDGDPTNNRLANLRWDTPKGNAADQVRHGTRARLEGPENPNAKLTEQDMLAIPRLRMEGRTWAEIAAVLGVCVGTIYHALRRTGQAGRYPQRPKWRGTRNPKAKLAEADLAVIRGLHREGLSYAQIGERFHVHESTVRRVVARESWRDCMLDAT